ncbi:unnamed protein product [Brassica rapa subsp. narinosa]
MLKRETVRNDEDAEEKETVRNDEDAERRETVRNKEDVEERETVRNVEGAVVFRDERGEKESADTMVETEKKDLEGRHEIWKTR